MMWSAKFWTSQSLWRDLGWGEIGEQGVAIIKAECDQGVNEDGSGVRCKEEAKAVDALNIEVGCP